MKYLFLVLNLLSLNSFAYMDNCVAITKDNLCVELEWDQSITLGISMSNTVKFKDLNQSSSSQSVYVSPGSVEFYGWMIMENHSHGTRPVKSMEISPGIFRNSKIFYMEGMKGIWQFKLKIKDEDLVLHSLKV